MSFKRDAMVTEDWQQLMKFFPGRSDSLHPCNHNFGQSYHQDNKTWQLAQAGYQKVVGAVEPECEIRVFERSDIVQ